MKNRPDLNTSHKVWQIFPGIARLQTSKSSTLSERPKLMIPRTNNWVRTSSRRKRHVVCEGSPPGESGKPLEVQMNKLRVRWIGDQESHETESVITMMSAKYWLTGYRYQTWHCYPMSCVLVVVFLRTPTPYTLYGRLSHPRSPSSNITTLPDQCQRPSMQWLPIKGHPSLQSISKRISEQMLGIDLPKWHSLPSA